MPEIGAVRAREMEVVARIPTISGRALFQCSVLLHHVYREPGEPKSLLEEGLRRMESLPAGTNPQLRFVLRHELARAEMSLARNRAAEEAIAPDFSAAAARLRELKPLDEHGNRPGILEERRQMLAEIEAAQGARPVN